VPNASDIAREMLLTNIESGLHQNLSSLSEVNNSLLDQVEEFFISYNKSRGKKFKVTGQHGPKRGAELQDEGIKAFRGKKKKA
jgi:inorganic pyrophosphatase